MPFPSVRRLLPALGLAAVLAGACGSSPEPAPPKPPPPPPPPVAAAPPPPLDPLPPELEPEKAGPTSYEECKGMLSGSAASEDVPVTVTPGAGQSERFKPHSDLLKKNRAAFRCCYEVWLGKNPQRDAKVAMRFRVDPEGKLEEASVNEAASTAASPEMYACMTDLAKALQYPPSPQGELTNEFAYEFGFTWHR